MAGINETMDAFQRPIRVTAEYVTAIGQGRIPPKITDAYRGDFNDIKTSLNDCIDAVERAGGGRRDAGQGRRGGAARHPAPTRPGTRATSARWSRASTTPSTRSSGRSTWRPRCVDQISKGQIPEKITAAYAGDFNTIKENLNRCVEAVNAPGGRRPDAGQGRRGGAPRHPRRRHPAPGRLPPHRGGRQRHPRLGHRAAQRGGPLRRADLPGAHPRAHHRPLPGRLQHHQGEPQHLHRRGQPPGRRRRPARRGGGGRPALHPRRRRQAPGRLPQDRGGRQPDPRRRAGAGAGGRRRCSTGWRSATSPPGWPATTSGDHAAIKASVNATASALHDALAQVAAAVEQVSAASTQIASSSQSVASGASRAGLRAPADHPLHRVGARHHPPGHRERHAGQHPGHRRPAPRPATAPPRSSRCRPPWSRSRPAPSRPPRSSATSTTSPSRPTSWPSTPPSRRPGPARPAAASRWSPRRSAAWRSAPRRRP